MPSRKIVGAALASLLAWPAAAQVSYAPASDWVPASELAGLAPSEVLGHLTHQAGSGEHGSRLRTVSTDIRVLDAYLAFDGERPSEPGRSCRIEATAGGASRPIFVKDRLAGLVVPMGPVPPAAPEVPPFVLAATALPSSDDLDAAVARMLLAAPLAASPLRGACLTQHAGATDLARARSAGGRLFAILTPGVRLDAEARSGLGHGDRVERFAASDGRYEIYRIWRRPGGIDIKAPWDFVQVGVQEGVVVWTAEGLFSDAIDKVLRDAGYDLKS